MTAQRSGVYIRDYGNYFFAIEVEADGYRFVLHCDESSFRPHIKRADQKSQLEKTANMIVEKLNAEQKGGAA